MSDCRLKTLRGSAPSRSGEPEAMNMSLTRSGLDATSLPSSDTESADYRRIETAIRYIETHRLEQPSLENVAAAVNLSPYHFQRLFTRWAGVSPKRFLGFLTYAHAREMLEGTASVLDAALDSGLSGPGRLHDLFVTFEAVTPGDIKRQGEGMTIRYGFHPSPFGACIIAMTERGICRLAFIEPGDQKTALSELHALWPLAELVHDQNSTGPMMGRVFAAHREGGTPITVQAVGTNFQVKVWEALLKLPFGRVVTYSQLAESIGHPRAARAVGNAVSANPLAFLIPCHSVIRSLKSASGLGNYRWGTARRKAIVAWEAAQRLTQSEAAD